MKIIYKIISNFINNKSLYIGEKVTMSEHMIQSAMLAEKAKCSDDLICAGNKHYTSIQSYINRIDEGKEKIILESDVKLSKDVSTEPKETDNNSGISS